MSDIFDIDWLRTARNKSLLWGWLLDPQEYTNDYTGVVESPTPMNIERSPAPLPPPPPQDTTTETTVETKPITSDWQTTAKTLLKRGLPVFAVANKISKENDNVLFDDVVNFLEGKLLGAPQQAKKLPPVPKVGDIAPETSLLDAIQQHENKNVNVDQLVEQNKIDHPAKAQNLDPRAALMAKIRQHKGDYGHIENKVQAQMEQKKLERPITPEKPTMQDAIADRMTQQRAHQDYDQDELSSNSSGDWMD